MAQSREYRIAEDPDLWASELGDLWEGGSLCPVGFIRGPHAAYVLKCIELAPKAMELMSEALGPLGITEKSAQDLLAEWELRNESKA